MVQENAPRSYVADSQPLHLSTVSEAMAGAVARARGTRSARYTGIAQRAATSPRTALIVTVRPRLRCIWDRSDANGKIVVTLGKYLTIRTILKV